MYIPIRELKSKLSSVLARAQQGEIIEVTSHNKPVARIVGIPRLATSLFGNMLRDGSVSWSGNKPALPKALPTLSKEGKSVSSMVLEDRA
jgi:prevent-host-death family protein